MPTKVILNPHADVGRGIKNLETIKEAVQPIGEVDIVLTEWPGHAIDLAGEAIKEGYDLLVAAGGDGTVNELVNSILNSGKEGTKLGVIPIGTGNDFAYALGISDDVPTAVKNIIEGRMRKVDLAVMEDDKGRRRYFANNMGVGLDANVIIRTAEISALHGFPKYMLAVLITLARDFEPVHLKMRFDQEEIEQDVLFTYFGIGPRGGGGFLLTPDASHEDDLIDSCTVPMLGRLKVISLISSAINGTHVHTPYANMRQNKQIVIQSVEAMPIQIDGEIYARPEDDIHHLIITSLPAALELIV
jgi:YegS/Rv2252/BmrU family lipid kinase